MEDIRTIAFTSAGAIEIQRDGKQTPVEVTVHLTADGRFLSAKVTSEGYEQAGGLA